MAVSPKHTLTFSTSANKLLCVLYDFVCVGRCSSVNLKCLLLRQNDALLFVRDKQLKQVHCFHLHECQSIYTLN